MPKQQNARRGSRTAPLRGSAAIAAAERRAGLVVTAAILSAIEPQVRAINAALRSMRKFLRNAERQNAEGLLRQAQKGDR